MNRMTRDPTADAGPPQAAPPMPPMPPASEKVQATRERVRAIILRRVPGPGEA